HPDVRARVVAAPILIEPPLIGILVVIDNHIHFWRQGPPFLVKFFPIAGALRKVRLRPHWRGLNCAPLCPSWECDSSAQDIHRGALAADLASPAQKPENRLLGSEPRYKIGLLS